MAALLGNLIQETANSPGTGILNLLGASTARAPFSFRFASGAKAYYVITDGTQTEIGVGTYTAGSPNTLSRDTVIWNSSVGDASPGALNFTGSVTVYNSLPAEKALYLDSAGLADVQGGQLINLLSGSTRADAAARRDEVGQRVISTTNVTSSTSSVIFALPSGFNRFRIDVSHARPNTGGQYLYAAFSTNGGASFDFGTNYRQIGDTIADSGGSPVTTPLLSQTGTSLALSAAPVSSSDGVFGFMEFDAVFGGMGVSMFTTLAGITVSRSGFSYIVAGYNAIVLGFASAVPIISGQFKLLGSD